MAQLVKNLPTMQETWVRSLGWEDSLEKEMATHSSTLALKTPWMEELGSGYCPWGCKESGTTEQLHFLSMPYSSMHCSLPGSFVREISQARILEWVAISFSRESSRPRDQTSISFIAGRFSAVEPLGKPRGGRN